MLHFDVQLLVLGGRINARGIHLLERAKSAHNLVQSQTAVAQLDPEPLVSNTGL